MAQLQYQLSSLVMTAENYSVVRNADCYITRPTWRLSRLVDRPWAHSKAARLELNKEPRDKQDSGKSMDVNK
jgi:hypothetical protein